jgi:nucleotide sugar dehydrogenase
MKIGVIGNGFVGKATCTLACKSVELYCYDINPALCNPKGCTLKMISECDLIFISVPTPMKKDGSCYLKIIETVIGDLSKIKSLDEMLVLIRSTVPPGTSDNLNCYFMPEFLTEKHYLEDFKRCKNWIFGVKGKKQDIIFKEKIQELFKLSHDNKKIDSSKCSFLLNKEAEMVKLFRNIFLATKVSFCNEIYDYCNSAGINYNNMIKVACDDDRIKESHSMVPGPDGKRGFGGTCFPKDINNLLNLMKNNKVKSYIIENVIRRNEEHDRYEKDWEENNGRSYVYE